MKPADLVAKMLAQREQWVELEPGKRMCIRRPDEVTAIGLRNNFAADDAAKCCVNWEGITEADLLGAEVGASDAAEFSPELCSVVLRDKSEWLMKVIEEVTSALKAHFKKKAEAAKN